MHRTLVALATGVVMVTLTPTAFADRDAEREALSRLVHELEALHALVDQAEAHADRDARIRFEYDWLRHDLERVRNGIREHLRAPRAQPRRVEPLQGDYRR